ncbi:TetR-like C-terminal domain-containing protein [Nocardia sp. NPDC051570]|uniref:TetR-like C-terminal domain-containing protein n=1 Tax=Nocardia sp. NPDC051570 TaxID=3364324 RepID=UPI0037A1F696
MVNSRSRQTNSAMRAQLIEAGIELLETDGPESLQARRVAAAAGASTMAVYTHFGGMTELLGAIVAEAFARFGAALSAVAPSADPVADFFVMGYAYRRYALDNPQRYRLMFGLATPSEPPATTHDFTAAPVTDAIGAETFEQLVTVVDRMIAAERIRADPIRDVAARLWSLIHGIVLLDLSGSFGAEDRAITQILIPATVDILVGMGADRTHIESSLTRAAETIFGRAD